MSTWRDPSRNRSSVFEELPDLIPSLLSSDRATRWVTLLFWIFFGAALTIGWLSLQTFRINKHKQETQQGFKPVANFTKLLHAVRHQKSHTGANLISLGSFSIHLRSSKTEDSGVHLAEIEIVLLCDSPETRDLMDSLAVPAQDQITQILGPIEREQLLSVENRSHLKKNIIATLNAWLPHGKVQEVYFSKLVLD